MAREFYLILCPSTSHMLRSHKLLTEHGIPVIQVPVPPSAGTVCSTALKLESIYLKQALEILRKNHVLTDKLIKDDNIGIERLLGNLRQKVFLTKVLRKIVNELIYEEKDLEYLLKLEDKEDLTGLFSAADNLRRAVIGDTVEIRAAIEFSNFCQKNCFYCGLRKHNWALKRYRMTLPEIVDQTCRLAALGIRTVILQSGEDYRYDQDSLVRLIKEIKNKTGMRITLSLGERPWREYAAFRKAGANNYLLKIETTNEDLFKKLHPDDDLQERMQHTLWLKELGYIVGSGNIIGLPGQNALDIARDILWFKKMEVHMIGIGPFVPAQGTPLADAPAGDILDTLKAMAVARLVCRNSFIPSTTALATLNKEAQKTGLTVGANTIMLVSTPVEYKKDYCIYNNKVDVNLEWALSMIQELGREKPRYLKEV